jgi:hypothetical protein
MVFNATFIKENTCKQFYKLSFHLNKKFKNQSFSPLPRPLKKTKSNTNKQKQNKPKTRKNNLRIC